MPGTMLPLAESVRAILDWLDLSLKVKDIYKIKYLLVFPAIGFERARVSSLPLTLPEQWPLSNIRR